MNWLLIAITSHFLSALVYIIDKFVLSKKHLSPIAYSFYVGYLGILALLLFPFGFFLPSLFIVAVSFLAGSLFVLGNLFFYQSIDREEVSRIVPIIGGAVPVFSLFLSYIFLTERLGGKHLTAFSVLVLGGVIMSWPKETRTFSGLMKKGYWKKLLIALVASLCFAASFVSTKFVFLHQSFINGFIWTRIGGFLAAAMFLLWPKARREIKAVAGTPSKTKTFGLPLLAKIVSALAYVLLTYAIYLGSVSLVNALQGVQYVFLLLMALVLSRYFPRILKEQIHKGLILQKIIAIIFISLGLVMLAF